jgi:hypothetical protein
MKLQRTTLLLLVSAVLLGSYVYFSETQGGQKQETTKTKKQPIFSFKEDQIQSLTIYTNKDTWEFERVTGRETDWQMKTPKDTAASNAAISFLVNLLVQGKSDRIFTVPTNQRQEYGLDQPFATVKVQLKNQQTHRLILGKPVFDRSFIYAQADPPPQTPQQLQVLLVPIDFEYAVNRPLSEWQNQPEKSENPKPSPTTGSPMPSPTGENPKPSPTAGSPKPSPTGENPKPSSPTVETPKPSPTAGSPKPSPTAGSPKPSPTVETPKLSPTSGKRDGSTASPTP